MKNKGFTPHLLRVENKDVYLKPKKGAGFTLFEILVVIGVIVLIALVTTPLLVNYQKTSKLRSEARILATNLRLTQQLAVTEQKIYGLSLNPINNSYKIINTENTQIIKTVELASEVSIKSISGLTDNTVKFNATGGVLETGIVTLTNSRDENSIIQIKPSGYVQIND